MINMHIPQPLPYWTATSFELRPFYLTLLHSEQPKPGRVLVVLSAIGLICGYFIKLLSSSADPDQTASDFMSDL